MVYRYKYYHTKQIEKIWIHDEECPNIIKEALNKNNIPIMQRLDHAQNTLHNWGKTKFVQIPKIIKTLQEEFKNLYSMSNSAGVINQINDIEQALDEALKLEELWWNQRAIHQMKGLTSPIPYRLSTLFYQNY